MFFVFNFKGYIPTLPFFLGDPILYLSYPSHSLVLIYDYLNEPVGSDEVDCVLRVEEFCVSQTLLAVVDQPGKLLVKKSGYRFRALVVSVFYSEGNHLFC